MPDNSTKKTCLLVGLKPVIAEETENQIISRNLTLLIASNLSEVKAILPIHPVDIVIMGAGLDLKDRISVIEYVFENSDTTTVHMKDRSSGPQGFVSFIDRVLNGFLGDR